MLNLLCLSSLSGVSKPQLKGHSPPSSAGYHLSLQIIFIGIQHIAYAYFPTTMVKLSFDTEHMALESENITTINPFSISVIFSLISLALYFYFILPGLPLPVLYILYSFIQQYVFFLGLFPIVLPLFL